jgi:hypothetical protein
MSANGQGLRRLRTRFFMTPTRVFVYLGLEQTGHFGNRRLSRLLSTFCQAIGGGFIARAI